MSGCVNEGPDKRLLKGLTCRLQGWLSFRSKRAPKTLLHAGPIFVGWPLVVAVNSQHGEKYFHARLGWRWDAHPETEPEQGGWYIFSAAAKDLDHPIEFWKDPPPPESQRRATA